MKAGTARPGLPCADLVGSLPWPAGDSVRSPLEEVPPSHMKGPGRRQAVAGRPPALRGRREESDGRLTKQRRTAVRRCSDSHGMRMGVDSLTKEGECGRDRIVAGGMEFGLWICDGQRGNGRNLGRRRVARSQANRNLVWFG